MAYNIYDYGKNYLLIFNNETVQGREKRTGTDKDEAVLEDTFTGLGFDVEVVPDPTKHVIMDKLKNFFDQDLSQIGCVIVAVLTHGCSNTVLYGSDGSWYEIKDILKHFNHKDLVGKPKILIIQACRGDDPTTVFAVPTKAHTIIKSDTALVTGYSMPNDVLIIHCTSQDKPGLRIETDGSWFIQTLCEKIGASSEQDLLSLLVAVKRKVAIDYDEARYSKEENNLSEQNPPSFKQVPETTTTFTKRLYFKKFENRAQTRRTRVKNAPSSNRIIARDSAVNQNSIYAGSYSGVRIVDNNQVSSSRSNDTQNHYYSYIHKCLKRYLQSNPNDGFAMDLSQIFTENREGILLWSKLVSQNLSTKNLECFYPYPGRGA